MQTWCSVARGDPEPFPATESFWVTPAGVATGGVSPVAPQGGPPGVLVVPTLRPGRVVAAAIVPVGLAAYVTLNHQPLGPGITVLAHQDRLAVDESVCCISAEGSDAPVAYDPAVHGDNLFCARTKARLAPGEPVVACPGVGCGLLYKAEAWCIGLPCAACQFDPQKGGWRPTTARAKGTTLNELLQLAETRSTAAG